jgi:ABC-type polysaccharide/polyol phosphate export permease
MTTIFTVVFSTIFGMSPRFYATYVMSGLTCWSFLTACCLGGCNSFFLGEAYIRQTPTPLAIYPLRTVLAAGFHFLIGICLVLVLALTFHRVVPILALLSLVPSIVLFALFGWSLAVMLGLANVRFRDTHHLAEVGLQALYFLTPVMYVPDLLIARGMGPLVHLNPVVPFLNLFRTPIMEGRAPDLSTYGLAAVILAVSSGLAMLSLRRDQRQLIFYL